MSADSQILRLLAPLAVLPQAERIARQSAAMARLVPFLETAGVCFEELSPRRVCVRADDRPALHNHIGGIHACVSALLAETATGFVSVLNTPDDKLLLLKSMNIRYTRRSVGAVYALAELGEARAALFGAEERGHMMIPCRLWDDSGEPPAEAELVWAWLPKEQAGGTR